MTQKLSRERSLFPVLLGALLSASAAVAQSTTIPMPPLVSYSHSNYSGFWFELPPSASTIEITGLRPFNPVQGQSGSPWFGDQIEVRRFATSPPSGLGTVLFQGFTTNLGSLQQCSILVYPGDVISITSEQMVTTNAVSYVSTFGSSAAGNAVTLHACHAPWGQPISAPNNEMGLTEVWVQPALPLAAKSTYGTGCSGLTHDASAPPSILGTANTIDLVTANLPAGTTLGATVQGLIKHDPGIDLSAFGLPGCFQYASPLAVVFWQPGNPVTPFSIPPDPSFAGLRVRTQGAAFVPGINPASAVTSNGLELLIGF